MLSPMVVLFVAVIVGGVILDDVFVIGHVIDVAVKAIIFVDDV